MKENEMISLKLLIDNFFNKKRISIPLLQRNYKWDEESAAALAEDIWDSYNENTGSIYTIGMITLYGEKDNDNNMQLVDGQQRMVTLTLLLTYLNREKKYFDFTFERDDGLDQLKSRKYFLNNNLDKNIDELEPGLLYTDTCRFKKNYDAIKLPITTEDIERINKIVQNRNIAQYKDQNINDKYIVELIKKCNADFDDNEIDKILLDVRNQQSISLILKQWLLAKRIARFIGIDENITCSEIFNILKNVYRHAIIDEEVMNSTLDKKKEREKELIKYVYAIRKELLANIGFRVQQNDNLKKYIYYILNNVQILLHVTSSEPIDEFLNINKNKTKFVISDYIKFNLIIDTKSDLKKRKQILYLFKSLSKYMYEKSNDEIFQLINQGYYYKQDENRLKILFCDRYYENSKKGYVYELEYDRLTYYKSILDSIKDDIFKNNYWSAYNGFNCLHKLKGIRFFDIFGSQYNEMLHDKSLEEVIFTHIIEDKKDKDFNYFLQSQLYAKEKMQEIDTEFPIKLSTDWVYIMNDRKLVNEFISIFKEYALKRKKVEVREYEK
ncbi:DUF262 domain-containing protein [Clostridium botulinum]|uniref:DUF262 domain-containing protein n=1 Tax=Clostridium botulinum TaxID=1491 RepID=UPI00140162AD|nr:DUF262 domain-containing protein [Clostridium botulinum]MBY6836549.1 DUF262 domain-containing protein [Clostridium botulinum]NFG64172.1 DUF262 domain-containing protein [Clostridium botulinum]NFQ23165.1 DUF262 domain-containing protein [Clostridium botulinum]